MNQNDHLCVVYIKATKQQVWEALTHKEFTRLYFHSTDIVSDWQSGSKVVYYNQDGTEAVVGEVIEASFPDKLSFTWHVQYSEEAKKEGPSRVTFTLESIEDTTRLTLVHDQFVNDSVLLPQINQGWIAILCNLKTLLETGETLAIS